MSDNDGGLEGIPDNFGKTKKHSKKIQNAKAKAKENSPTPVNFI